VSCEIIMIVVPILLTSKEYNIVHIISVHIILKFKLFFLFLPKNIHFQNWCPTGHSVSFLKTSQ